MAAPHLPWPADHPEYTEKRGCTDGAGLLSIEPWNTAAGGSAACEDMLRKSVDITTDNPVSQKRGHCALFLPSGEDGFGQRPKTGQGTCPLWVLRATPQALRELIGIKIYRFQGSFEPIFFSLVFHRLLDTTVLICMLLPYN